MTRLRSGRGPPVSVGRRGPPARPVSQGRLPPPPRRSCVVSAPAAAPPCRWAPRSGGRPRAHHFVALAPGPPRVARAPPSSRAAAPCAPTRPLRGGRGPRRRGRGRTCRPRAAGSHEIVGSGRPLVARRGDPGSIPSSTPTIVSIGGSGRHGCRTEAVPPVLPASRRDDFRARLRAFPGSGALLAPFLLLTIGMAAPRSCGERRGSGPTGPRWRIGAGFGVGATGRR